MLGSLQDKATKYQCGALGRGGRFAGAKPSWLWRAGQLSGSTLGAQTRRPPAASASGVPAETPAPTAAQKRHAGSHAG